MASRRKTPAWLSEKGPKELESLFRAVVFHPRAPILVVDDNRHYHEASAGASRVLGLSREEIIGRRLDDFAASDTKPQISERWRSFLEDGEQAGNLRLMGPDGTPRDVEYLAKRNVLPVRHLLVLRDHARGGPDKDIAEPASWAQDYALFLLNENGEIADWYAGAERMYQLKSDEAAGRHMSTLYPAEDEVRDRVRDNLKRAAAEGHFADEGWSVRQDGSRFWANVIIMALKDERGNVHGFAGVVRDFSDRHERDEKLRRSRAPVRPRPMESTIVGVIFGEFDRITEANDRFFHLAGYRRDDLLAGRLQWPQLTPSSFAAFDELAHEELLRFGACTPFEKELIRKDGTRVPVLVTSAVVKLSPFRWVTFVTDLRERNRQEKIEAGAVEVAHHMFEEIVGTSTAVKRVLRQVEMVAPTEATVLIQGETGTGKELIARAIHRISPRRSFPFITLNCAAIPTGLLESELFGYERGAFTGALHQKIGRFETAHKGTLFLDEVGDIPLELQPKLLRALQEKSFERLGGTHTIPIDVRLVTATNRNLTEMVGEKLFRSDLYYRLKVFPIVMPPLRDHPEDIPALVRHFTRKYAAKMDRTIDSIPSETMEALVAWSWPGNVRELENFVERAVILSRGPSLQAPLKELTMGGEKPAAGSTLQEVERDHILRVLRDNGGVVSNAAARLGLPRTTLHAIMKKLGISRGEF